ncbi:MAG: Xaa-Pro dipeptidase [Pseudomonadota bacterium]
MTSSHYSQHVSHLHQLFNQVMALHHYDFVAIHSGFVRKPFMDDTHYPFVSNPYFNYWYPLTVPPHSWIIVKESSISLKFYRPDDFWHKVETLPDDARLANFDIEIITKPQALNTWCDSSAKGLVIGEEVEPWTLDLNVEINSEAALNFLTWHRAYKTDYEKEQLREANGIAVRGHKAAATAFHSGGTEFEINAAYFAATHQNQHSAPYDNIIALNENAAILHYTVYESQRDKQRSKESFLIDAGAKAGHYCSDITRTYSGANDDFAKLIQKLDDIQQNLASQCKVGSRYTDLHIAYHKQLLDLLIDSDLVKGSPQEAWASGITQTFFPHGLGHLLGLQVHDLGGHQSSVEGGITPPPEAYPFLRCTRPVEANQVFTIEPGLYFIPLLLDKLKQSKHKHLANWQRIKDFMAYGGIRIEDNIIVNAEGVENITREVWSAA